MSQSWSELQRLADSNSRIAAQKLEEERRKREKLKQKSENVRPIDDKAIKMILERRRREQQQQKRAEEQRLKKPNVEKAPPKVVVPPKKPELKKPPIIAPTPSIVKKKLPNISYDDLMRYALLKANQQPIPKDLAHVADSLRVKESSAPSRPSSSTPAKKTVPTPKPSTSKPSTATTSVKAPPLPSTTKRPTVVPTKAKPMLNNRPKSVTPSTHVKQTNGVPSGNHRPINGHKPPTSAPANRVNHSHAPSRLPPRKRPVDDTDDEDDEEMADFIVDDDDEDGTHSGFDYRKELHETLKKNFRFDKEKYRGRFLDDDDDDDLQHMESSFDQIQKEEDFSRKQGLQEDIDDYIREQAEKKKRAGPVKKRSKTTS